MTIRSLLTYLFGSRRAILDIASSPQAVWLGLVFVLSAGFAREYDGEDLLREPWHVGIPLAASLATSFLLFSLVWGVAKLRGVREGTFRGVYRRFLGLYWMTAPLAWLYAIPVERFLSAGEATQANLWLLGIVSLWRVLLMTRVVAVLFSAGPGAAMCLVMLFADSLMLFLLTQTPLPVVSFMGGIRLTESEQLIQSTVFFVTTAGVLSWPIWFFGSMYAADSRRREWRLAPVDASQRNPVSAAAWSLGAVSLLAWAPLLLITQPEQQLRSSVEWHLRHGQLREALRIMSAHHRRDFPPHWDPPPRVGYGQTKPHPLDLMEAVLAVDPKLWVREVYLEKYRNHLGQHYGSHFAFYRDNDRSREELHRHLAVLERIPEADGILEEHRDALTTLTGEHSDLPEADQERVRALLAAKETAADGEPPE